MKLSNWINQWTATVALDAIGTMVLNFAIKLVIALVILFIGSKIIKYIVKLLDKFMGKVNLDQGVERFLVSLAKVALYAVLVIIIAHELGIDTTSFIALLASSGVAIGLALQGSLSNFAGGVLILVLHPFGIGDYIIDNSSGKEGVVEDIKLFYTKLVTGDNKVVTIPNGALSNAAITNVSEKPIRRIDFNVGISYTADIKLAKQLLDDILNSREKVLKDKPINVFVGNLGESAVDIGFRCWVNSGDYWTEKWEVTELVKECFDKNGIEIPFNQIDVHVKND